MFRNKELRVIVHIGFHRTGTTAIQYALAAGRQELARSGVLYPFVGCPKAAPHGHHLLPWSLKRRPQEIPSFRGIRETFSDARRDKLWREFGKEIEESGAHTVVLSSEEFDTLTDEEISSINYWMPAGVIIPIAFVRNHADFVESMYRITILYHGFSGSMKEYIPVIRSRLDIATALCAWKNISGRFGSRFVSYERPGVRRNAVEVFFSETGLVLPPQPLGQLAELNKSVPAFVCECVRHLRSLTVDEERIQSFLQGILSLKYRSPPLNDYVFLNVETRKQLDDSYKRECQIIAADAALASCFRSGPPALLRSNLQSTTPAPIVLNGLDDALLALACEIEN